MPLTGAIRVSLSPWGFVRPGDRCRGWGRLGIQVIAPGRNEKGQNSDDDKQQGENSVGSRKSKFRFSGVAGVTGVTGVTSAVAILSSSNFILLNTFPVHNGRDSLAPHNPSAFREGAISPSHEGPRSRGSCSRYGKCSSSACDAGRWSPPHTRDFQGYRWRQTWRHVRVRSSYQRR